MATQCVWCTFNKNSVLHSVKGYHHAADCPNYLPPDKTTVESYVVIRREFGTVRLSPQPSSPSSLPSPSVRDLFRVEVCGFNNTVSAQFVKDHPLLWFIAVEPYTCAREILALAHKRFDLEWWQVHTVTDIQFVGKLVSLDGEPLYERED